MIHLIVGNTGAGKTTYANKLKKENGGLIFSIDHWNKVLFIPDKKKDDGLSWFLERIERSESIIMQLITQLENAGLDLILDLGLSKFAHREKFREFAKTNGFKCKIHFLDISKQTRWTRIYNRNTSKGDTFEFEVTKEDFDFMENWFEKPSTAELKSGIILRE